jgi:predicted transposase/invertase (TIGR01784 family)
MISKYLDPKNDLAFKKIFGQEKHKRIPIAFLNAVFNLTDADEIVDLEFLTTVQPPEIEARKESVVDVLVRDQKGATYIVEMQVAKIEGFEKRAQYYAAKTYCAHFNKGHKYADLKKVIFLAITSYVVFPEKRSYKSDHRLLDSETYEHDLKDFSFTFVELPKFKKSPSELETVEDKWYYFLKHAEESNSIEAALATDPEIKEAYEVLERFSWTEQELEAYDRIAMAVADYKGGLAAARNEGLEEGEAIGRRAAMLDLVPKLIQMNLPIEEIAKATGLSPEEIQC